jgi:hypothetical protein
MADFKPTKAGALSALLKWLAKNRPGVKAPRVGVQAPRKPLKPDTKVVKPAAPKPKDTGPKLSTLSRTAGRKKVQPTTPSVKATRPALKTKPKISRRQGRKKTPSTAVTTTQPTAVAKKPGTALVPVGGGSRAVTGGGTKVGRTMKPATRTAPKRITNKSTTPTPKPKSNTLRNIGIGAGVVGAGLTANELLKKNKGSAAAPSTSKTGPSYRPGNAGPKRTAPKVTPKSSGPSTRGSSKKGASKRISAGPNTGFGPKGNIFPGSSAERAALIKMYGGTGSAAAKAAMAGKQGNIEAGRKELNAAKKKRLSKPVERKSGGSVVARQVKGWGKARKPKGK